MGLFYKFMAVVLTLVGTVAWVFKAGKNSEKVGHYKSKFKANEARWKDEKQRRKDEQKVRLTPDADDVDDSIDRL